MPISIPKFFQRAFAQNGGKQDVPITGDNSGGRASYDVGFPPVTRIPIVAGGIPPFGTDFNGVLYDLSQAIQYVQSGVAFPFNQDFATAIGGYEIGAIVSDDSDKSLMWVNGTANNVAFPSGWTSFAIKDPTELLRGLPLVATASETLNGVAGKLVDPARLRGVTFNSAQVVYETPGVFTWTVPDILRLGVKKARIRGCGGGGGGSRNVIASGGYAFGGGGGGAFEVIVDLTGVSSVQVTIGAGGAGAPASTTAPGAAGGATSFGTYASASGGAGGITNQAGVPGGEGVSSIAGALLHTGSSGHVSFLGSDGTSRFGGQGGGSIFGPGGMSSSVAWTYGGGGGGVFGTSGIAGAGLGGVIVIDY